MPFIGQYPPSTAIAATSRKSTKEPLTYSHEVLKTSGNSRRSSFSGAFLGTRQTSSADTSGSPGAAETSKRMADATCLRKAASRIGPSGGRWSHRNFQFSESETSNSSAIRAWSLRKSGSAIASAQSNLLLGHLKAKQLFADQAFNEIRQAPSDQVMLNG